MNRSNQSKQHPYRFKVAAPTLSADRPENRFEAVNAQEPGDQQDPSVAAAQAVLRQRLTLGRLLVPTLRYMYRKGMSTAQMASFIARLSSEARQVLCDLVEAVNQHLREAGHDNTVTVRDLEWAANLILPALAEMRLDEDRHPNAGAGNGAQSHRGGRLLTELLESMEELLPLPAPEGEQGQDYGTVMESLLPANLSVASALMQSEAEWLHGVSELLREERNPKVRILLTSWQHDNGAIMCRIQDAAHQMARDILPARDLSRGDRTMLVSQSLHTSARLHLTAVESACRQYRYDVRDYGDDVFTQAFDRLVNARFANLMGESFTRLLATANDMIEAWGLLDGGIVKHKKEHLEEPAADAENGDAGAMAAASAHDGNASSTLAAVAAS